MDLEAVGWRCNNNKWKQAKGHMIKQTVSTQKNQMKKMNDSKKKGQNQKTKRKPIQNCKLKR